jgi:hypothetical protein
MQCPSCQSLNQVELPAEINIHLPGRENLAKPSVLVFPKLLVCLACGSTKFTLPEAELRPIRQAAA